jgi:hypothetical protein
LLHCGLGFGAREVLAFDEFVERFVHHFIVFGRAAIAKSRIFTRGSCLPVPHLPSKLSRFNCPRILALFKATFRKPMERE